MSKARETAGFNRALTVASLLLLVGCGSVGQESTGESTEALTPEGVGLEIITPDEVDYIPLNPARGDAAPQAGVLWGDIRSDTASGTLLRFADGFSSPPHIHNITYRAVVIEGQLHNAPPNAPMNWMGPGSFWVQAAVEDHITAAKPGSSALAFLEIETGPYLVEPSSEAFRPLDTSLNLEASDIEWSSIAEEKWISSKTAGSAGEFAVLWGDPVSGARLIKLSKDAPVRLKFDTSDLRAVVVQGAIEQHVPSVSDPTPIGPGGFFRASIAIENVLTCTTEECLVYLRTGL
ncbi:DUF4437 domain-containing protein [uncultured Erythrobacter sp.]|uniref:DUF4437 domain-containing protein n=1 Tax=uncultured Erythrobacter sp. TaxID=263913 RepID=UPI00262215D1|nr:DUF4437 domain-containing protein [uncultured Erythrobacter sp.]